MMMVGGVIMMVPRARVNLVKMVSVNNILVVCLEFRVPERCIRVKRSKMKSLRSKRHAYVIIDTT